MAFRNKPVEAGLDAELRYHFDRLVRDFIAAGVEPAEARRRARLEFGGIEQLKEDCRDVRGHWLEDLVKDLRFTARSLRRSPGFLLVSILSLALGIGADTAIFSLIHAVLLRGLPYPEPNRLVRVGPQVTYGSVTMPEYEFWNQHASAFASTAGYRLSGNQYLVMGGHQEWVRTMTVTAGFFRTLGVNPVSGREFNSVETRDGGPRAIVLGHGLWRRATNSDPAVVGRTVALDGTGYTVVGILPAGFWFHQEADAFVPLRATGSLGDSGANTEMIARVKPGVTLAQAESEMPALTENFRRSFPDLVKYNDHRLTLVPFQRWLTGDVRLNLLLLFGAVGLLLLIGCANVAGLLLARLAARQKEIAMRLALGCSRGRLLRQFLIENLLLTLAGGLIGIAAARSLLDVLVAFIPFDLHASSPIRLDAPVLTFALVVALATGIAFSLAPIVTASRLDLQETLKAGGRSSRGGARQRTRGILVVSEVALSVTLLVAAGLLIQSLYRLHQERLGFTPRGLITFTTPIDRQHRRTTADLWRYQTALLERFQALPGVGAVAAVDVLPLGGKGNLPTQHQGHPEHSIGGMEVRVITPAYFEVMGIPIRRGRAFRDTDTASSPPVILVNETVARLWWPDTDPAGDRVVIGRFHDRDYGKPFAREVLGVVGDTKSYSLTDPPRPTVYIPASQMNDPMTSLAWVLRANLSTGVTSGLRRTIAEIDPSQRIGAIRQMEDVVASVTASSRFDAWLFVFLAGLALLLSSIGIYGLLSFSVARRAGEIGTRMALGASRSDVLMLVLKQGFALVATGLVLGLAGALAATRSLTALLFGVRATDPASFVGVSAILLAVGLLASYLPARRATRVDPVVALRDE